MFCQSAPSQTEQSSDRVPTQRLLVVGVDLVIIEFLQQYAYPIQRKVRDSRARTRTIPVR